MDIVNKLLKKNNLYEFILSSKFFDGGVPNTDQTAAIFDAQSTTKKLYRTHTIQKYNEFIELRKTFLTTLEYTKMMDIYFEFRYLGPDVTEDIYFLLEFPTIPYTLTSF